MASDGGDMAEPFEPLPGMTVYWLVLKTRGPTWTPGESSELERLQAAHLAHLDEMNDQGLALVSGPLLDGGYIRGVSILRVVSRAEAEAICKADPSVQAGRLSYEVHPWMVHKGILEPE
jgi:uncharacterized protein